MSLSIKKLAHAGFKIKADGKVLYVDLEEHCKPTEKADIILSTHSHFDHCDSEKINKVRADETVVIAPKDCRSKIGGAVISLSPGEKKTLENITVEATEAYNYKRFRSPGNLYHPKGLGVGYLITVGGKTIYHAGDTDFIPEMKNLEGIEVALLPTGDTYTMDNEEAADAAVAINPTIAIPMHTWDKDTTPFKKKTEANSSTKVVILEDGEEYAVE
ncbi:MAG: MBL fold metallo-hydrolase [Euryarchaeota archaeon]|nr:MBL fold metallo-hydrolase [Euryarchaeota archaeon]